MLYCQIEYKDLVFSCGEGDGGGGGGSCHNGRCLSLSAWLRRGMPGGKEGSTGGGGVGKRYLREKKERRGVVIGGDGM